MKPINITDNMKRVAFKMKLNPGFKEEYRRRHAAIWPEIVKLLEDSGVSDYSIFLDEETNTLFGVQKVSGDQGSQDLGGNDIQQKWCSDVLVGTDRTKTEEFACVLEAIASGTRRINETTEHQK